MILVTTGTNGAPFDRLLKGVDGVGDDEPLVIQHGPSQVRPSGARCVAYLSFDDFVAHIRRARVVVTHGGVGSVVVALMNGRRPLVVPRMADFGEAVDDHQLAFGRKLAEGGLVTLVTDPTRLGEALSFRIGKGRAPELPGAGLLARELGTYLRSVIGETVCDPDRRLTGWSEPPQH
jgi:UDP-N-acetylglucosamine transferase subunit ALG13